MLCCVAFWISTAHGVIIPNVIVNQDRGVAPLAVFFDASQTTSADTIKPFHHLSYEWDFSDPEAGVWQNEKSKAVDTHPIAAHVFIKPGTYQVKLTVKYRNSDTAVYTTIIQVDDPDVHYFGKKTVCFSNDGDFAGCPTDAKRVKTNSFDKVDSYDGNDKRLLLRAGHVFRTVGPVTIGGKNATLSVFGEGAKPQITCSHSCIKISSDVRVVGIRWSSTGRDGADLVIPNRRVENALFMNNEAVPGTFDGAVIFPGNALDRAGLDLHDGLFFVENNFVDFGFGSSAVFVASKRLVFLGNHIEDSKEGEHIIRGQHIEKGLFAHNWLGGQRGKKAVLTIRNRNQDSACSAGCGNDTHHVVVHSNLMFTRDAATLNFVRKNKSKDTVHGHDFIIDGNFMTSYPDGSSEQQIAIEAVSASDVTIRNNIVSMKSWKTYRGIEVSTSGTEVYNNSCYASGSKNIERFCVRFKDGDGQIAKNNVFWNKGGGKPIVVGGAANKTKNLLATDNPFVGKNFNSPDEFLPQSNGPLVDVGVEVDNHIDYYNGVREGKFDIGAFEVD